MEQGTGIEPAFTAWEAVVLPIYEPCISKSIIPNPYRKSNPFLSISAAPKTHYIFVKFPPSG